MVARTSQPLMPLYCARTTTIYIHFNRCLFLPVKRARDKRVILRDVRRAVVFGGHASVALHDKKF